MNQHDPTILIVEDEKFLLKAWVEIFRREGFNVLTALNWEGALSLALRWRPDLLVIDLVLSHADSLTLVKKLREHKWGQTVPIMFLNSWLGADLVEGHDSQPALRDYYLKDNWSFEQVVQEAKNKLKLGGLKHTLRPKLV